MLVVVTLQRNLPVAALLAITTFRSEPTILAMVLGGVVLLRVLQIPFAALAALPTFVGAGAAVASAHVHDDGHAVDAPR
jgi:hypothetical protein